MTHTVTIKDADTPSAQDAISLYLALGWGSAKDYSTHVWEQVLANSRCIAAYEGDRLVGLVRYLTDGFHDTQVCEFCVAPDDQGRGIGTQMLERLVALQGKTSIYIPALNGAEGFFNHRGLKTQPALTMVSRRAA